MTNNDPRYYLTLILASAAAAASLSAARADTPPQPQIPVCDKKIGTLAVTEPENAWWTAMQLDSPAALIKVYVSQSKCFTLVDRGKGLAAIHQREALGLRAEEQVGSN